MAKGGKRNREAAAENAGSGDEAPKKKVNKRTREEENNHERPAAEHNEERSGKARRTEARSTPTVQTTPLDQEVVRSFQFVIDNADKILVEKKPTGNYYETKWPKTCTGWQDPTRTSHYTPVMLAAGKPCLQGEGNYPSKYAKVPAEGTFGMGVSLFRDPPHAGQPMDPKKPNGKKHIANWVTEGPKNVELQAAYIKALRVIDETVKRQLFFKYGDGFDSITIADMRERAFGKAVQAILNEKYNEERKDNPRAERQEAPTDLEDLTAILKEHGKYDEENEKVFQKWFRLSDITRKSLVPWPESEDSKRDNPTWERKTKDENNKLKKVRAPLGFYFRADVYQKEWTGPSASGSLVPQKMQAERLAKNHKSCAGKRTIVEKEKLKEKKKDGDEEQEEDGKEKKEKEKVPYVYVQVPIRCGQVNPKYVPYPWKSEHPIIQPNALVQVLTDFKIIDCKTAVGVSFDDMQEILLNAQGKEVPKEINVDTGVDVSVNIDEEGNIILSDDEDEDQGGEKDSKRERDDDEHSQYSNEDHAEKHARTEETDLMTAALEASA